MTPEQYVIEAQRTLPTDLTEREMLCMLAMGLVGEYGELQESPVSQCTQEAGDVLWYAANLAAFNSGPDVAAEFVAAAMRGDRSIDGGPFQPLRFIEVTKKAAFHGAGLFALRVIQYAYPAARLAAEAGGPDVLSANIEKLKRRYPDGFSVEASQNRRDG